MFINLALVRFKKINPQNVIQKESLYVPTRKKILMPRVSLRDSMTFIGHLYLIFNFSIHEFLSRTHVNLKYMPGKYCLE